ncbi:MAG: glycosyltransferase family 39 protein [Candidatus Curtissbacteria bacterium]|nr:glycosyltransferase family 39 protein [Candidatus Curtissbacteria bacterium]
MELKNQISRKSVLLIAIILLAGFLRFYQISSNPPGLYWDEVANGYDAYSILKTAHDHHGQFLPFFFESFGDWKLPGYIYLSIPSILVFGLNEFAIRFPSALLGTLTVPILFLLVNKLTKNINLALLSSLFLAISPWHIQFSRAGFESTVGLFMAMSGTYLFLVGLQKGKSTLLTFSFLLLTFSMYTYHAYRIFTPLIVIAIVVIFKSEIKKNLSKLAVGAICAIVVSLPLLAFTFSPQGRLRATSQSVFQKEEFSKEDVNYNQKSKKPLRFMSKYWYQSGAYYTYVATNAYFDHFSPTFLFVRGDQIGRHSQVDMGQLHVFELPLILASLFALRTVAKGALVLFAAWLILGPVPAIIVSASPHANRTLQMAPIFSFLSALGALYLFSKIKFRPVVAALLIFALYHLFAFTHMLFVHYPVKFSPDWQDGNRKMVELVKKYQDGYDKVYISNNDQAYIYLLFYTKYDPKKFIDEKGDKNSFNKYIFVSSDYDLYNKERILYVSPSWQKMDGRELASVSDSGGRRVYGIWELGGPN